MKKKTENTMRKTAVTLMELLIALAIMGGVILGAMAFDRVSRGFLASTERQTRVVNAATFVADHIAKRGLTAIGDINNPAVYAGTAPATAGSGAMLFLQQDSNGNGRWEPGTDLIAGYTLDAANNTLLYCPDASTCAATETLADRVFSFVPRFLIGVRCYAEVTITARFDVTRAADPTTNPEAVVETSINVPGCSAA
ncbi:MAG: hypothetical protein PHV55_08390 [Candidatus Omnitrophica bacterium]|nr:hypothetical protein [Candidatus Omnitrophota bacterium]